MRQKLSTIKNARWLFSIAFIFIYSIFVNLVFAQSVGNAGFESGALSPWSTWNPSGISSVATGNSRTGTYSSYQSGGETSLEQVVSNLMPNTTYIFGSQLLLGGFSDDSSAGGDDCFVSIDTVEERAGGRSGAPAIDGRAEHQRQVVG